MKKLCALLAAVVAAPLLQGDSRRDGGASDDEGTKIAFVSNRDGDYEIYVMNADGSGQTNLTNNRLHDFAPSFPLLQKKN